MKEKKRNFLTILISPSGGGKTTICKRIVQENSSIEYSISYTTRKIRKSEINGKDYFFVNEKEFKRMRKNGEFIESAKVHENYYATSKSYIFNKLNSNTDIIMDIDVQGAKQIQSLGIDCITIFILPKNEEILKKRLADRGQNSKQDLKVRIDAIKKEIKEISSFDYLVINDDLQKTVKEVKQIIEVEKKALPRNLTIVNKFLND